jgi:hypothetical protein
MARTAKTTWRLWLRLLAMLLLLGSAWGIAFGVAGGLSLLLFLVVAGLLPLLWPRQFGAWWGLLLLLLAIVGPTLYVAGRYPLVTLDEPLAAGVMVWALAAWTMLPATMALLLWRRMAGIPLMLLGLAVIPVATLLALGLNPQVPNAAPADTAAMLRLMAGMTPMWFVTWACCLAPIFFAGSFIWLLYLERMRGISPLAVPAAAPSATAAASGGSEGKSDPTGM